MPLKRARSFICERCNVQDSHLKSSIPCLANLDTQEMIEINLPDTCKNKELCRKSIESKMFDDVYDPMINVASTETSST